MMLATTLVECILCRVDDAQVLIENAASGRIVRCHRCGLIFANPRNEAYIVRSAQHGQRLTKVHEHERREIQRYNFEMRLSMLHQVCPDRGRLLDVGCSTGVFLELAQEAGWQCRGVETAPGKASYCQQALGLDVFHGTLEEAAYPPAAFDVVTAFHVIEHLAQPLATLGEIHRVLKPGGLLLLETPNVDSLPFRLLGRRWRQFIPSHFWFFSPATLKACLARTGFQLLRPPTSIGKRFSVSLAIDRFETIYRGQPLPAWLKGLLKPLINLSFVLNPGDVMIVPARKPA